VIKETKQRKWYHERPIIKPNDDSWKENILAEMKLVKERVVSEEHKETFKKFFTVKKLRKQALKRAAEIAVRVRMRKMKAQIKQEESKAATSGKAKTGPEKKSVTSWVPVAGKTRSDSTSKKLPKDILNGTKVEPMKMALERYKEVFEKSDASKSSNEVQPWKIVKKAALLKGTKEKMNKAAAESDKRPHMMMSYKKALLAPPTKKSVFEKKGDRRHLSGALGMPTTPSSSISGMSGKSPLQRAPATPAEKWKWRQMYPKPTEWKFPKETLMQCVQHNPKRETTFAHARFESYKKARTIQEFFDKYGWPGDLENDLKKGYITILKSEDERTATA